MNIVFNKFKEIYGDKYDYSLSNYINNRTHIDIICKEHNIKFVQTPETHLVSPYGCPTCYANKRTDEILTMLHTLNNPNYDYSMVRYNRNYKIDIICNKHGIFTQNLHNHMNGRGCPKCDLALSKLSKTQVINNFIKVHGNKYDYSLLEYENNNTDMNIICKQHNIKFKQTYQTHLNSKRGCYICNTIQDANDITEKCISIHGNRYNYSLITSNKTSKINIICRKHGIFTQRVDSHLNGSGCPKCAPNLVNYDDIMNTIISIHGNKYDYSKVNYVNTGIKIEIICKKHGSFFQTPSGHANGQGCPHCATQKTIFEIYHNKFTILYYICVDKIQYKVGLTKKSVESRYYKELRDNINIEVLREVICEDGAELALLEQSILIESANRGIISRNESKLHNRYTEIRTTDFIDIFDKHVERASKQTIILRKP